MSITKLRGGQGPEWIELVLWQYRSRQRWIDALETRIGMTDAGLRWLMRVKSIGFAA